MIRSTGQSLLDYVPEGATREGFAGTYATQENFRLMRAALDETSQELGRYVRLTNYASGLCMPEIAALAGLERLDMMLNDSMYGILFRDINPIRTFVDQRFSRQVHARAGIIINTGEDNYLTTADAVEAAHTVTTSQLLNEYFAKEAGLEDWQLGLGHAFEIDPEMPDSFRLELAHAMLARDLFPDAPLKWMPPTRHMTGDVFRGYLLDGFFNLVGALTGQGILLVGMMTEAVVTPWLSDRDLALQNVRYVMNAAGELHEDFRPAPDGFIAQRARQVLGETIDLLEQIEAEPGDGAPARGDRRRHLRADEAPGRQPAVASRASPKKAPATATRPAEILEGAMSEVSTGRRLATGTRSARTATPPATAWCSCPSPCPMPHSKVAEGAAAQLAQQDGHGPGARRPRQADGGGVHLLRRLRPGEPPRRPVEGRGRRARLPAAHAQGGQRRDQAQPAPSAGRRGWLHRHRRPHRRHRRDPQHQGLRGREGPGVLPRAEGRQPRRPGVACPQLVERAREEKADAVLVSQVVTQRDAHLLNTREMSAAFRESYPPDRRPLLVVGGPRFDETMAADLGRRPRLHPGYDARRGRVVPRPPASRARRRADGQPRSGRGSSTAATCRTPTPTTPATWSTVPTASVCSATWPPRCASVTDGDEGLFASYSDVQFRAPVRAGDVLEVTCELVRVGTRSRVLDFAVTVVARGVPTAEQPGAAEVLDPPLVATTATGTVVVPPRA